MPVYKKKIINTDAAIVVMKVTGDRMHLQNALLKSHAKVQKMLQKTQRERNISLSNRQTEQGKNQEQPGNSETESKKTNRVVKSLAIADACAKLMLRKS